MFIHQQDNSIGDDLYNSYVYRNYGWTLHFHKGYELVVMLDGELFATVGDREFRLTRGDSLLLMPYQLHSYITRAFSEMAITVFSGSYISEFDAATAGKIAVSPKFRLSPQTFAYLSRDMADLPRGEGRAVVRQMPKPPLYVLKAGLYAACADFDAVAKWQEKPQDNQLIFRVLSYVEEHFTENITLAALAYELSYEYHYLSRVLHESLHVRFRTLVNQYRCDRAKLLITSTQTSFSDIAMSCGFGSIRSFNRIFLEMTGVTPSEMRKN